MKNVIIIGTGASASEISSYFKNNTFADLNLKGYLEFEENIEKYYNKYTYTKPILGDINNYRIKDDDFFIMGITNISFRNSVIKTLKSRGAKFINIIHPTAIIAESATMGEGNIIYPFSMIGPMTKIGNFNTLTSYSFISHDCNIGNGNFLSTAGFAGNVIIGDNNFFGIRSTVIPNISVGSTNTIQAGMTVDKDVADNTTVFYKFKEKVMVIEKN